MSTSFSPTMRFPAVSLYDVLPVCFIQCRSIVSRPSPNFIASSYSQQAHHYYIHVIFSPIRSSSSVPSAYSLQPSWLLLPFAFLLMHSQDSLSCFFFFPLWSALCHGFFPYEECLIRSWVGLSLVVGFTPYLLSCSITLLIVMLRVFLTFHFFVTGFLQNFT